MGIGLNLCLADVHIALAKHGVVVELSYFPFERACWSGIGMGFGFCRLELGNWGIGDGGTAWECENGSFIALTLIIIA